MWFNVQAASCHSPLKLYLGASATLIGLPIISKNIMPDFKAEDAISKK
jgi:hypothetical protein